LRYNDTLAAISRFPLATVGPGSIGLHRLVQMVVQARLAEADERTWVTAAVRLLREAFPDDSWETSSWQRCERLLPHLLAATGHAERLGVAGEETGWLLDRAATYLRDLDGARALFEQALRITEAALGPDHPSMGLRRAELDDVLPALGHPPGTGAEHP
jgi:hypothetical protein